MKVHVVADSKQMGASAAAFVRDTIVDVVAAKGEARIIIATGECGGVRHACTFTFP